MGTSLFNQQVCSTFAIVVKNKAKLIPTRTTNFAEQSLGNVILNNGTKCI